MDVQELYQQKYGVLLEKMDKDILETDNCDLTQFKLSKQDKPIFKAILKQKLKRLILKEPKNEF